MNVLVDLDNGQGLAVHTEALVGAPPEPKGEGGGQNAAQHHARNQHEPWREVGGEEPAIRH